MLSKIKNYIKKNTGILIRLDDIAENMNWNLMNKAEFLFEKYKITAAFHGHIHQSKHYYYKGSLITCNPRGYRMYNEVNDDFDEGKVIKLKKEL